MKALAVLQLAAIIAIAPWACSKPEHQTSQVEAINTRPQSYDRFIAIIKLKSPALLAEPSTASQIENEQQELIAKLTALSPDVRVLYRYKMVLNAVAVVAPKSLEAQLRGWAEVAYIESQMPMYRPQLSASSKSLPPPNLATVNSAQWIGTGRVRQELNHEGAPIDGRGIRVGVIDTGIDYTHAMFGGAGSANAYKAIDPGQPAPESFPNAKVTGGIDFVGSSFNTSSPNFDDHIPQADNNPLDEGGHGTHVAGTIAGKGDGVSSYDGVAPAAELYALKVFGKDGSSGDAVIIAALEYAADPDGNFDAGDRLDVINLSLGGDYGTPHLLYSEAVANLTRAGTVAVMAAGNSGDQPFIVGAPSTAKEAISVAAAIDNMDHNWQFPAVKLTLTGNADLVVEAVEANFSKPLSTITALSGKLVYLGLADRELSADEVAAVQGKVALIDRGVVSFEEKIQRAARAGASGVVVANNREGTPLTMPGKTSVDIPAIMISKDVGEAAKAALSRGEDAVINFKHAERIKRPELIDTITDFSSAGPRAIDGLIKPEVAAPGFQIWSASMGGGDATVAHNGTSMAAPHVAGVAALLRQRFPQAPVAEIKSRLVTTAKSMTQTTQQPYAVARAGAGRVDAYAAAVTDLVFAEPTVSLGTVLVENRKSLRKQLTLTNLGAARDLSISWSEVPGLSIDAPTQLSLAADQTSKIDLEVTLSLPSEEGRSRILSTMLEFKDRSGLTLGRVPLLAVASRVAHLQGKNFEIKATSPTDASGASASVTVDNASANRGAVLPFNLIAQDERANHQGSAPHRTAICDLQSAGYRVLAAGQDHPASPELLQIGIKLYTPVTNWHLCEISLQIDADGDGIADQELVGTFEQTFTNNPAQAQSFSSLLTDAKALRKLRQEWEAKFGTPDATLNPNFSAAMLDIQKYEVYSHATIAVLSADVSKLAKTTGGDLRIKLAVLPTDAGNAAGDDYLAKSTNKWMTLPLARDNMPFVDLPTAVPVAAHSREQLNFTSGGGKGRLLLYFPDNVSHFSTTRKDEQQQILVPHYVHAP